MKRKFNIPTPPRPLLKQLIDAYKRHPCLWKRDDPDYKNKSVRSDAFERVLMKFHEIRPSGNIGELKTYLKELKLQCLRDVEKLRRSSKRRNLSRARGPKTWFFPLMIFLLEEDCPELPQLLESVDLPEPEEVDLRHPKTVLKMLGRQKKKMKTISSTTQDASDENQQNTLQRLLKMYKNHPVLWNPEVRSSSRAKEAALRKLLKEYQKLEPGATTSSLNDMLEKYKCEHTEELVRLLGDRANGTEYEPATWHFDQLKFLNTTVCPPELISLLRPDELGNGEEYSQSEDEDVQLGESQQEIEWLEDEILIEEETTGGMRKDDEFSPEDDYKLIRIKQENMGTTSPVDFRDVFDEDKLSFKYEEIGSRKRKRTPGASRTVLPSVDGKQGRDRFSVAAENIVCKLRHLELEQRVRAEILIERVMHLAEFNGLNQYSRLVVEDPL